MLKIGDEFRCMTVDEIKVLFPNDPLQNYIKDTFKVSKITENGMFYASVIIPVERKLGAEILFNFYDFKYFILLKKASNFKKARYGFI